MHHPFPKQAHARSHHPFPNLHFRSDRRRSIRNHYFPLKFDDKLFRNSFKMKFYDELPKFTTFCQRLKDHGPSPTRFRERFCWLSTKISNLKLNSKKIHNKMNLEQSWYRMQARSGWKSRIFKSLPKYWSGTQAAAISKIGDSRWQYRRSGGNKYRSGT